MVVSVLRSSRALRDSFLSRARQRRRLKSATVLCGNGGQRLRRAPLQRI